LLAMPEERHVAREICRRCGYAAEMSLDKFRGPYGVALLKRLRCSQCGARATTAFRFGGRSRQWRMIG
jgi:ribosomal protein L40E